MPPTARLASCLTRAEPKRQPVHAIAQAGRLWPVREDMAEMAAAAAAQDFGPLHEQSSIRPGDDRARQWPEETRPARAAVELGRGAEQRQGAARANKDAAA